MFLFNYLPPTEIYTLSLHDALPILADEGEVGAGGPFGLRRLVGDADEGAGTIEAAGGVEALRGGGAAASVDRKSTRLNSSHVEISYAVFCLKKKIKV